MKNRHGPQTSLVRVRAVAQRFAFLALILAAFGLMLIGKADTILIERMRTGLADAVTPILDVMGRPAASVAEVVDNIHDLTALRAENERLTEENRRLHDWHAAARLLEAENRRLKGLLDFSTDGAVSYLSARVVAETGGSFVHAMLVNAGRRDGVRKGQAAVTGQGLVGRVESVGERSARILLITDLNSRIPVLIENSRAKAILVGDNKNRPKLQFITNNSQIVPGDRVATSGSAGVFPPGLQVGEVVSVDENGVRVEPFVEESKLEFVRLVDYGLQGIVTDEYGARMESESREN